MKASLYTLDGEKKKKVPLPRVFSTSYRPNLIKKAVLSIQSKSRQPYGADKRAGKRSSAHYHGKRDYRYTMMNREMARLPRIHSGGYLMWRARNVPQAVKGRKAHPPKPEKNFVKKINKKEKQLAIKSAIASTANIKLVKTKHKTTKSPIIVEDKLEQLKKTKKVFQTLKNLELSKELERCKKKKIRAGKGKQRGRKYKRKKGPLIIAAQKSPILKSSPNIPGIDTCTTDHVNPLLLAPGTQAGRLSIITEKALTKLGEKYG